MVATAVRAMTLHPVAIPGRHLAVNAVCVAVIGGICVMLGQAVMLAVNRVTRARIVLTLLASGLLTLANALIQAVIATLCAAAITRHVNLGLIVPAVLISYAPYWLGFLAAIPYMGTGIARALQLWQLVVLWRLLTPILPAGPAAMATAFAAWIGIIVLNVAIENSRLAVRERLFRLVTNTVWHSGDKLARELYRADRGHT